MKFYGLRKDKPGFIIGESLLVLNIQERKTHYMPKENETIVATVNKEGVIVNVKGKFYPVHAGIVAAAEESNATACDRIPPHTIACKTCGCKEITEGDRYCKNCGKKQGGDLW